MLVLTRKLNESIIIGDEIKVTVVEVKGEQVKLGISAPKRISVHRKRYTWRLKRRTKRLMPVSVLMS